MAIVLRANELNTLLYKYFLEAGLNHTAYSLFHQASLSQPLQQFRFDIKSGHLLSLLQKALIYAQIEAHITLNEYAQCNEPFYLLKSHTCKVVEKTKKERAQLLQQLGQQLDDSIKRTNFVYNTAIVNRQYADIVYDAKGEQCGHFQVKGTDQSPLLHNHNDFQIDLLRYDGLNDEVVIQEIYPCLSLGQFHHPIDFESAGEYLVELFEENRLTVFRLCSDNLNPFEFQLQGQGRAEKLLPNCNLPQLLAVAGNSQYWIVNLQTLKLVGKGQGLFSWREFDEYLVVSLNSVSLHSISQDEPLITFSSEAIILQFSNNGPQLYLMPKKAYLPQLVILQNQYTQYLRNSGQERSLKQVIWANSNGVDYLCWLTDAEIKIYDISLSSYSRIIDVSEYDSLIHQIATLRKADRDQSYLIALGANNLLVYDLTNSKIQRVETEGKSGKMFPLSAEKVAVTLEGCIYFLVGQYIEALFR